jgi:hypothetical protein
MVDIPQKDFTFERRELQVMNAQAEVDLPPLDEATVAEEIQAVRRARRS